MLSVSCLAPETNLNPLSLHILPVHIDYDGPARVSAFFVPEIEPKYQDSKALPGLSTQLTLINSPTNPPADTISSVVPHNPSLMVYNAYFRGRKLSSFRHSLAQQGCIGFVIRLNAPVHNVVPALSGQLGMGPGHFSVESSQKLSQQHQSSVLISSFHHANMHRPGKQQSKQASLLDSDEELSDTDVNVSETQHPDVQPIADQHDESISFPEIKRRQASIVAVIDTLWSWQLTMGDDFHARSINEWMPLARAMHDDSDGDDSDDDIDSDPK